MLVRSNVPSGGVLVVASFVSTALIWCAVVWYGMMFPRLVSRWREDGHCGWLRGVMLCDVMWCHVMRCGVMPWRAMSCDVMWCNEMERDGMLCDVMGCTCVMRWIGRWCALSYGGPMLQQNSPDVHPNARCDLGMRDARRLRKAHVTLLTLLLQYYFKVLQSTTAPLLLRTTKYFSGTTWNVKSIARSSTVRGATFRTLGCKTRCNYDIHVWWLQHMKCSVRCAGQTVGCKTQWNYDVHAYVWWP